MAEPGPVSCCAAEGTVPSFGGAEGVAAPGSADLLHVGHNQVQSLEEARKPVFQTCFLPPVYLANARLGSF